MSEQTAIVRQDAGVVMRQEFGASQQTALAETAATAVAAREQAAVQARYIVALQRPRDMDAFRVAILRECKRPGFAVKARYSVPRAGKFITGPSIRFIEAAMRCFTNVYPEVATVYDSPAMRICRVSVTDLESNVTYTTEVQINKTVERRGKKGRNGENVPPEGRTVVMERVNSEGEVVYVVLATDEELLSKQNSLISKAIRTNSQRLLPGDIVDECMDHVVETQRAKDSEDPDAAKRKIMDAFDELGISPSDVSAFLGRRAEVLQPKELVELRAAYTAIKEGSATWNEIMDARGVTGSEQSQSEVLAAKLAAARNKTNPQPTNGGVQGETAKAAQPAGTEREILGASSPGQELSDEQNRALDAQLAAEEGQPDPPPQRKLSMGRRGQ